MTEPRGPYGMDEEEPSDVRAQERVAFLLGLRGRGISDISVLRAMEIAPRENFVPRKHADLAWRNVALPIACGQTMPEPLLVARMMQALSIRPDHRVLEIGSGSGYATAILSQLAGEVVSFERYRSLAMEARTRLESFEIRNATVAWDDGLAAAPLAGLFDRILIHGRLPGLPGSLAASLKDGGVIVLAREREEGRRLVRLVRSGDGFAETVIAPCRASSLEQGRSAFL